MVKSTEFSNGLKLVTEHFPGVRSVSVGFWVGAGSGFETADDNGISHFTEHVVFKGTEKYTPFEIAKLFEDYGASVNAFTSKEATCYYFKSIDENLDKCFGLLSHIFYESSFPADELDKERKVIAEEINMVGDEPEDICYDKLAECSYAGTPLARTILGPTENVLRFGGDDVRDYMRRMYTPDNTVIAMVGNIPHDKAVELVEQYVLPKCGDGKCVKAYPKKTLGGGFAKYEKDFEQVNFALSFPTIEFDNPLSSVQSVVSFCLGTGMSSRLFQVLREQKGLVYNVYTSCSAYKNNGLFGIYVNTGGKNLRAAIDAVKDELRKICANGLTDEEVTRAKAQLKSNALFSVENMLSTMLAYGKYALYTGKNYSIEDNLGRIASVTRAQTEEFCKKYFDVSSLSAAYVGKSGYIGDNDISIDFKK